MKIFVCENIFNKEFYVYLVLRGITVNWIKFYPTIMYFNSVNDWNQSINLTHNFSCHKNKNALQKAKYSCVYNKKKFPMMKENRVKSILSSSLNIKYPSGPGKQHAHRKKLFITISTASASIISTNFQQNGKNVSKILKWKAEIINACMKKHSDDVH